MPASLKAQGQCQRCIEQRQRHRNAKPRTLARNGRLICCSCGYDLGPDPDRSLHDALGDALAWLVQDCMFGLDWDGTRDTSRETVYEMRFQNRAGDRCWATLNYIERNYGAEIRQWAAQPKPSTTPAKSPTYYTPGQYGAPLPLQVEQALRIFTTDGFRLKEMPDATSDGTTHYARLEKRIIEEVDHPNHGCIDRGVAFLYGWIPKNDRVHIIRVELSWLPPVKPDAQSDANTAAPDLLDLSQTSSE